MSEPRRSTRARAREEAAPAPPPVEIPKETPSAKSKSLKRKRSAVPLKDARTAPATDAGDAEQPSKPVLPIRLVDGQPLPTLPEPQPLDLPMREYQDIQHSGVLSASLKQSRAVWVSGANFRLFHALFVPPKKVADRSEEDKLNIARQKEIIKNFPLVGEAQLVIEPHTFNIRLYGPKEHMPVNSRPVQRKTTTYGQWGNHNQPGTYQYNHSGPAYQPTPQHLPPPPKPQPPPPQKAPQPAPSAPQNPAPDPVIHMLAQRAGQDPELKAVMKIVAAGQATKEQLEFFQGHISELTEILNRQKEAAKASQPKPQPRTQPQPSPAPKPIVAPAPPSQPIVPPQTIAPAQSIAQAQPQIQPHQQSAPRYNPTPQVHQPKMASVLPPRQPPFSHSYNKAPYNQPPLQQYKQPQHVPHYVQEAPPPKPTGYRPLVFDFVEGNGDKYYFPSNSFMEWLPAMQGAKFSFLITRMKTKPVPKEEAKPNTPATPAPVQAQAPAPAPTPTPTPTPIPKAEESVTPATTSSSMPAVDGNQLPGQLTLAPMPGQFAPPAPPVPTPQPYIQPRIEDYNEQNHIKDIDFYQPVTVLVISSKPEVLHSLPRAIRPPAEVEKYMNEVFDTARRAEETYLAFRLPREGGTDAEDRAKSGDATTAAATRFADLFRQVLGGRVVHGRRKV